jgi:hypothetical protein
MTAPTYCENCGGFVQSTTGSGRTHEYHRGLRLPVPETFPIPTCKNCGEIYLSEAGYRKLEKALRPVLVEWQKQHLAKVIESIKKQNGVRLRDIELACGVTGTYLSHLLAGRNPASQTLIALLEAFSLYPEEFRRQLNGTPWVDVCGAPAEVARIDEHGPAAPRRDGRPGRAGGGRGEPPAA